MSQTGSAMDPNADREELNATDQYALPTSSLGKTKWETKGVSRIADPGPARQSSPAQPRNSTAQNSRLTNGDEAQIRCSNIA